MDKDFSNHSGYYIQEIARKMTIMLNEKLEALGITYSQFRVLNCLWKKGGLTQKEILEIICVKPSTLTGIINILVKKELVKRRIDNKDARIKRIHLTEKGKLLEKDSWNIILDIENEMCNSFSKEEKTLFVKWLKDVKIKLEE
ncbi:MAG: MarR family transcriptional regulator [Firmicutes bacterium]|nr:MarR family transcriptional regulator [Bacillota bacterium]